jgi:hypothetical protein
MNYLYILGAVIFIATVFFLGCRVGQFLHNCDEAEKRQFDKYMGEIKKSRRVDI